MNIEEIKHSVINGVQSATGLPHDKKPTSLMTMDELAEVLPIIRTPKRRCSKCGIEKDDSHYLVYRRKNGAVRVHSVCRECEKIYHKELRRVKNAKNQQ